jgi:protease II
MINSQVKPKRDPAVHVEELAMIVFTSIKNTSEWYELSFKDPKLSSALVKWAKQEIEAFADLYKDVVFGTSQQGLNFQVIADCFKITQDQCNKVKSFCNLLHLWTLQKEIIFSPDLTLILT